MLCVSKYCASTSILYANRIKLHYSAVLVAQLPQLHYNIDNINASQQFDIQLNDWNTQSTGMKQRKHWHVVNRT